MFLLAQGPDLTCNDSIVVDKKCVDGEPWKPHYADAESIVGLKNNTDIQLEIMTNGPVTTAFKVPAWLRRACSAYSDATCRSPGGLTRLGLRRFSRISFTTSLECTTAARRRPTRRARSLVIML
jgi:hypothetical protein